MNDWNCLRKENRRKKNVYEKSIISNKYSVHIPYYRGVHFGTGITGAI